MWKPLVIVATVSARLKDFVLEGSVYLMGVKDKVERAQMELQLTLAFLKDTDINGEDTLRVLVFQIMDVVQKLEDEIETYGLTVASRRRPGFKNIMRRFACIFMEGYHLLNVGREIDRTTDKLANLRSIFHRYAVISEKKDATSYDSCLKEQLRRTYSHVLDRDPVGLEAQTKEIIRVLVDQGSEGKVFVIWGMAGLGKTTLVKRVYHQYQSRVTSHFCRSAWVCVSPHFNVREIWDQIYDKLLSPTEREREENSKMRDDDIAKKLYSLLQNRGAAYLIVLDDMWSTDEWDRLKPAFPLENSKVRLLITTRTKALCHHMGRNCLLFQPLTLDKDQSLELFKRTANLDHGIDDTMEQLRDEMLRHCGGLPLAITMLAGLLARKNTLHEWERVCKNVSGYIAEYGGPFWVLALSYDDLPYHLKACFLYFSNFPKGSEISVKLLIKLWIAEGFISLGEHKKGLGDRLEDIAYGCLNELVERCVVHLEEQGSAGTIKTCRMHNLMRELCLMKTEEENILTCEYRSMESVPSYKVLQRQPMEKVRRLAIHLSKDFDELIMSRVETGDHIRSLFYSGSIGSQKVMSGMFKNLQSLRVLKVEGVMSEGGESLMLPNEIGNMLHLRFLSFKDSGIKTFPPFIAGLILLQTLDFRVNCLDDIFINIPNILWKLEHLRHLYLPRFYQAKHKLQLSSLRNLQSLVPVSSDDCAMEDLGSLGSLRKLGFVAENHLFENLEDLWKSAGSKLKQIQTLSVENKLGDGNCAKIMRILSFFSGVYKLKLVGPTVQPFLLHLLRNLMKLSLSDTKFQSDQMESIESLPKLRALKLEVLAFDMNCKVLSFSSGGFPELDFLSCNKVGGVSEWVVNKGAMPKLTRLSIKNCCDLKELPSGLRFVTTLKKLKISETLRTRVEQDGHDFYKIQHVPSITFWLPHE